MALVLGSGGVRLLTKAVHSLAKVSAEILIEVDSAAMILRAINTAKSAYFAVRLNNEAFEAFRASATVQTGIPSKVRHHF